MNTTTIMPKPARHVRPSTELAAMGSGAVSIILMLVEEVVVDWSSETERTTWYVSARE
jgi:hypothetical protein